MRTPDRPYLVIDDFLDEEAWTDVWSMLQFADFAPVSRTKGAWKLDEGMPLGSQEIITLPRSAELRHDPERPDVFPSEPALDHVLAALLAGSAEFAAFVGETWAHVTARAYVYPRGSALSVASGWEELMIVDEVLWEESPLLLTRFPRSDSANHDLSRDSASRRTRKTRPAIPSTIGKDVRSPTRTRTLRVGIVDVMMKLVAFRSLEPLPRCLPLLSVQCFAIPPEIPIRRASARRW
ncbi:hypothetical protein Poly30_38550 [Planctomycetes bacterium Poly30]|uniref:Uncharacterized protein n=1 Tax=Saltatorellus ferox TaxID=2528018 RepID=A0A518EW68_9BACT|nr:hypothetical protein Poly30_38550 [Planctomycetes bacterium Poly30]